MTTKPPAGNIMVPAGVPPWVGPLVRSVQDYIELGHRGPQRLSSYLKTALPDATKWLNYSIIVSNESGGRTIATSDGTNWRRVADGHVVS